MTFDQFHNGLRVLLNIDAYEFYRGAYGLTISDPTDGQRFEWQQFRDNPHRWFIQAGDLEARGLWEIVAERTRGATP